VKGSGLAVNDEGPRRTTQAIAPAVKALPGVDARGHNGLLGAYNRTEERWCNQLSFIINVRDDCASGDA
jgi:hypothetical protein